MKKETRITIEPSDIAAIDMECLKCHGHQSVPLGKYINSPDGCPNCGTSWPIGHSAAFESLKTLAALLSTISSVNGRDGFPFVIRFVLSTDSEKDKS